MTLKLSSKGQVVIPSSIRKKYKIQAHSKLELVDLGGEIVLVPLPKNPFREAKGILKGVVSSSDLLESRKRERQKELAK